MTRIPLSQDALKKELSTIKHLARVSEVIVDVDVMVRRKIVRKLLDSTTSLPRDKVCDRRKRWISLPFLGKFSLKLGRALRPFGFRPAFYNPTTLKKLFVRLKDPIPVDERSGVYKIECSDCRGVYIGETSRQMKVRVDEHFKAWSSGNLGKSAFADHLINSGHSFREGSGKLLHKEYSYRKRIVLEHIKIIRHLITEGMTVLNTYIPEDGLIELVYDSCRDFSFDQPL